jgi:DNA-binding response OmpR family regulator
MLKSQNIKIAIIENEAAIASMYELKLNLQGFEVKVAYNGEEGLKLCKAFVPDLILLDFRMPIMSGQEMLEKLRSYEWAKNIRVIILTNISKDEAPQNLRFLNVDRYIVKAHHTPKQVVEIIEEVLG